MSDSLQPHGLQHTSLPCPTPYPGVCSNSCPLSQWGHPTISSSVAPSPPALNLSQHQDLFQWIGSSNESSLHIRWPKYIGTSASVLPMNIQVSFRISFRIDWLDLFAVQGILKSLLQHHSSKASILWCSAFVMVQLSRPYKTTGKIVALTIWIFVSKVMSLLFNTLSRFVIAFLSRSKNLLISWLQSPSAVILEPKKIVCHCFHCFPIYLLWSDGTRCQDLRFLNVEF